MGDGARDKTKRRNQAETQSAMNRGRSQLSEPYVSQNQESVSPKFVATHFNNVNPRVSSLRRTVYQPNRHHHRQILYVLLSGAVVIFATLAALIAFDQKPDPSIRNHSTQHFSPPPAANIVPVSTSDTRPITGELEIRVTSPIGWVHPPTLDAAVIVSSGVAHKLQT